MALAWMALRADRQLAAYAKATRPPAEQRLDAAADAIAQYEATKPLPSPE